MWDEGAVEMITQAMLDYMIENVPSLADKPIQKQIWFTNTCFEIGSGSGRKHKIYDDAFALCTKYVRSSFGDVFWRIAEGLIRREQSWSSGEWCMPAYPTFNLTELISSFHVSDYLSNNQRIDKIGRAIRSPRRAILSKDSKDQTVKFEYNFSSKIQLNIGAIDEIIRDLEDRFELSNKDKRLLSTSKMVKHLSGDNGIFLQQYRESDSGRLYGIGISLQNCPKKLRNAALRDQFNIDISNCHFAILQGLALKHGLDTPQIDYYVNNRNDELRRLSGLTGEEEKDIKIALLAIIYGAGISNQKALTQILKDGCEEFISDIEVIALHNEVGLVGREIIDLDRRTSQLKYLKNVLGKSIEYSSKEFGSMLSHILQGYEAKIMRLVIEKHSDKISLLLHDGYIFKEEIDVREIEQDIKEQIGLDITMTMETC